MNSLSWLIYLSDVVPGIGVLFTIIGVGLAVVSLFPGIPFVIDCGKPRHLKYLVMSFFVGVFLLFAGLLVPSKNTILLIAASEMGETVVKTPEAQEVFTDLKQILRHQLGKLKETPK